MQIVDTSAIKNYDQLGNDSGLLAAASFTFVTATKVLTITDASTIPAGHAFAAMIIDVFDKNGNSKSGRIAAAGGNIAIDLDAVVAGPPASPALDMTGPVSIKATVVTDKGFEKTGTYYNMPVLADIAGATQIPFEA